jgi:hypothetical protein
MYFVGKYYDKMMRKRGKCNRIREEKEKDEKIKLKGTTQPNGAKAKKAGQGENIG